MSNLLDHFTDTDGTLLSAHAMDTGAGWTNAIGDFGITSNAAEVQTPNGAIVPVSHAEGGTSDGTLSVIATTPAVINFAGGLAFRVVDGNNLWIFRVQDDGATAYYSLIQRITGSDNVRATLNEAGLVNDTLTLSVVLSGTSIICKADGTTVLTYDTTSGTTAFDTATKYGLENYVSGVAFPNYVAIIFDDFTFTGSGGGGGVVFTQLERITRGVARGVSH